ncbi:MAG: ABC transporter ATP-binding protein/permease [Eggerthellaceae bacterium]|nr:ABC transporter ATP-binding protein/permease [Eggerthellaceae bacterium]
MSMQEVSSKRSSGISIMGRLIGLVAPLMPIMVLAIVLGVLGFLCAIFLTILAALGIGDVAAQALGQPSLGGPFVADAGRLFAVIVAIAVARGFLHYGEQYCNHFIAFKMLALIRHKVFARLRLLAPAKLEGRDKGNLVSIITSDIELLEVFYAHTISPIAIAVLTSLGMVGFMAWVHPLAAVVALVAYLAVGLGIPLWNGRRGAQRSYRMRNALGDLNSFVLDSLYGLDETIQYGGGEVRARRMEERSREIAGMSGEMNRVVAGQLSVTSLFIQLFSWTMLFVMLAAFANGQATFAQVLVATVAMMSSFGPVTALSNLSSTLNATLAAGQRVLDLLDEEPEVREVRNALPLSEEGRASFEEAAALENVSFSYEGERVLEDYSLRMPRGRVVGIHGPSGSGKSTILKLLMRFWDTDAGKVSVSGRDVRELNTSDLRSFESCVTQQTWLFRDTIANNIAVGKPGATREEVVEAAKKASLHEFVQTLPHGYDTNVGEMGDNMSGGEAQRIGLARAFLHNAPLLLLDEPTSNLDSLNEAIILKSLREQYAGEAVVLVSHRQSTMGLCDEVYEMHPAHHS